MLLLFLYISVALGFSFICSIAEAVILSVTSSHIELLIKQGRHKTANRLRRLKDNVNTPLAAILTLNTIAHTGGAAGAGAQAAAIFGDQYLGVISAVLTLLILIFSEIIPKTLGACYWKQLAPVTALGLKYLVMVFYPFVLLSDLLTRKIAHGSNLKGFNREEFVAMAELSSREGQIPSREFTIIKNTLHFHEKTVTEILTPRTVVFSVDGHLTIAEYFAKFSEAKFSRIPIYLDDMEHIVGFVLRTDLLLANAEGTNEKTIAEFKRPIHAIPESLSLSKVLHRFLTERDQMMIVIDEYGGLEGIVTLEDILEKMIGIDIVDESDTAENMRELAFKKMKEPSK